MAVPRRGPYHRFAAARIPAPRKGLQVVIVTDGVDTDAADPLADPLAGCLERLGGDLPVTVVDSSSGPGRPGSRELVLRHGGRYLEVCPGTRLGTGVNLALADLAERGLEDHDVLLLDPSARIGLHAVESLHARIGLSESPADFPAADRFDGAKAVSSGENRVSA